MLGLLLFQNTLRGLCETWDGKHGLALT